MLVCSAIIESGLDIPNANTIIINRADHFGLAQLYQLRGRVGRSHERAYAYLMIPGEHADHQGRAEAAARAAGARRPRRRLPPRRARPRDPRRRQPARQAAVGAHRRGRLRALHADDGRGGAGAARPAPPRRGRARDPARLPGLHPRHATSPTRISAWSSTAAWPRCAAPPSSTRSPPSCASATDRFRRWSTASCASWICAARSRRAWSCAPCCATASVTLGFHPEAPVEVDQLVALVERGKGRFRLSADFQLSFTPHRPRLGRPGAGDPGRAAQIQQPLPAPAQPAAAPGR